MKIIRIFFFISIYFILAFQLGQTPLFSVPKGWPKPTYDFNKNPITQEKITLGRALFYDPILSKNNTISCASCHSQYTAFTHVDHALSHGIEDKIGTRNSPILVNLAWQKHFMWDGAVHHLDMQALAPISNSVEMDENIANVAQKLQRSKLYPKLFYQAYGDSIITGEYILKAISQFMVTIISSNSKYDSVMRKESKFTAQQKNGYRLFKKNCAVCHTEPLFTNNTFKNNGLKLDSILKDLGRYAITANVKDSYLFKVPSLRNIEFSYPYMHDGRFKTLWSAVTHYNNGIVNNTTLSKELQKPIQLSNNEKIDLIAFLLTLSDRNFLFNPKFSYPKEILLPKTKE